MLTPPQVIPFLTHPQADVRNHAVACLRRLQDPALLLADRFWEAIEVSGTEASIHMFAGLADLPQTESSLRRMLEAFDVCEDEDVEYHLRRGLRNLDFPLLVKHREEVLNCRRLRRSDREHLKERLRLAEVPPQELWDQLTLFSDEVSDCAYGEFDHHKSGRLIEALARHPESAWPAMEAIQDDYWEDTWLEIFAADLLGRLRHRHAIKPLIQTFLRDDAEVLFEASVGALARIGTAEVVREIEATCAAEPESAVVDYAGELLGHIKLPESEELLVRLAREHGADWQCMLMLLGLTMLPSLEGLDLSRGYIERNPREPETMDLMDQLLTAAAMHGVQLPEAEQWRKKLKSDRRSMLATALLRSFINGAARTWEEDDFDDSAEPALVDSMRAGGRKIGRNEPCPCGSGKKYKKCCLNKSEGVHT